MVQSDEFAENKSAEQACAIMVIRSGLKGLECMDRLLELMHAWSI